MIKLLLMVVITLLVFALALVGILGATGNLSAETLNKLINPKTEPEKPAVKATESTKDDLDPIVRALKERDEQLKQREAKVGETEQRLKLEQQDIESMRNELQQTLKQIMDRLSVTDQGRDTALKDLAKTLSQMKPKNAADSIGKFAPEDAAKVLRLMKEKESGKILDSMDTEQRALVMRSLTQPPTPSGPAAGSSTATAPPTPAKPPRKP